MCFGLRFVLAALADFLLGSIFQFSVLTFVFFHLYNLHSRQLPNELNINC